MQIEASLVAELLALGVVTGFLAGLLGIGGGMVMVPVLSWVLTHRGVAAGAAVKIAIATSMATILFTSLSSVRAHHRLGAVRWAVVARMAPGIVLGGLAAGAGAFSVLKGQGLALLFAAFAAAMAVRMIVGRPPHAGRAMPGALAQAGVGAAIGFASALVGVGGAFISVPFMTHCNVPPRHAVGTSAALGFPIAAASTLGYIVSGWGLPAALPGTVGYLYLPALVIVSLASVSLAPWGARAAQRIDVVLLKRLFAVMLLTLSATMLRQALGA